MATDNNDFTHEFQIYSTDLNAGTMGTGKFLLFDNNINAVKVEDVTNIKIGGGEEGQVLVTDGAGNLTWATSSGGGGSQVNADWNSSSGASRILNKPDLSTYLPKSGGTLTGKLNAAQGAGTTGGYSFGGTEGGNDTGMFSNADGILDFYSNNIKIVTVTTGGVTSTQAITLPGNPTSNLQAATKQYVDSAVGALNNFSGNYNDLTNKPTVATSAYIGTTLVSFDRASGNLTLTGVSIDGNAATVTNGVYTSGNYSNPAWIASLAYSKLTDAPTLATVATSGAYSDLTGKPTLATVATSGSYTDLINKPSIFSGSYTDLTNKPTLFDGAYLSLTGTPNFAAVATSGSYDDLINKPSIPDLTGYATESWVNSQGFGSGSGGQTFDQDLNTTNDVTFNNVALTGNITSGGMEIYTEPGSGGSIDIYTDWTGNGTTGGLDLWLIHGDGLYIKTDDGNHVWKFDNAGKLQMPEGGDIVDNNGNSVLGTTGTPTMISSGNTAPGSAVVAGETNVSVNFSDGGSGKYVFNTNELSVGGNIVPQVDNAVDLGSPTNRFRHLYVAPGTIYLGDIKLSNLNGKLDAKKVINPGEENEYEDTEDSDAFSPVRGNGGATALEGLDDVSIDSPEGGQSLVYNALTERWINGTPSSSSGSSDRLISGGSQLVFSENGELLFPGPGGGSTVTVNPETAEFEISTPGDIVLNNTSGAWVFGNGNITLPEGGDIKDASGNSVLGGSASLGSFKIDGNYLGTQGENNGWGGHWMYIDSGGESNSGIAIPNIADQQSGQELTIYHNNSNSGDLVLNTSAGQWRFKQNGNLQLPAGGDIKDSNGNSVLGGSSGATDNIYSGQFNVTVNDTGVISMNTARGGIEFGAMPEVGGPQHLHIMRPAGQNGSTDLFFGDDYNYVKLPGLYNQDPQYQQGVEIGSSLNEGTVYTWKFGTDGDLVLPEGKTIRDKDGVNLLGAATSPQYGYFSELKHTGDNNQVNGEAVTMDSEGNSYVSYSYYNDNNSRQYGGVMKFSSSGVKLWSKDITSQNGNADYVQIVSLEYITMNGSPALVAFGKYYDNNTSRDVAVMYYISPTDGSVGAVMIDSEITTNGGIRLNDGVSGTDGENSPYAVVVGESYNEVLQKTFTPLAGSTVDKLYVSWAEYNASGVLPGEQLTYTPNGSYYGARMNAADTLASIDGTGEGIWLQVGTTEAGEYIINRVNGYSGVIYGYAVPTTLRVLGSTLGGVDGVNDFTFDFDINVFNSNTNNINAAVSNKQGTPISDVYCSAWNGKDWGSEIGNELTFNYELGSQAYLARFSTSVSWTKNLGATNYDRLTSVVIDDSNNIYAVGYVSDNINRSAIVVKYDVTGTQQWSVYVDSDNNMGNELTSIDLLSDGNIIVCDEDGTVTKLDSSNGDIMWQMEIDSGPSWDGNFRGTATPDGNYIFTNYEDNDYTMYVICISGSDGSMIWAKQISRVSGNNNGEIRPENDFDAQYIDCNSTHVTVATSTELNSNYAGLVFSLPLDGQNVDGTYGQYVINSQELSVNTQSTTSVAATLVETTSSASVNSVSPDGNDSDIADTRIKIGGADEAAATVAGIERHSASSGDNNITLAEEHNGKFLYYNGSNGNSWIYVPSNSDAALPIGFTVTVVMDEFNGNRIYVNNNTGNQNATINASGFNYNTTNYWKFGNDGKSGVYTIMKVDTDRWMLAGPDITED